jgi:DNA repair protein RadD
MLTLRPYQEASIAAVMDYWRAGGGNPLIDLATGLGKSVVIAKLTRDLLDAYPQMRVLMLVHVRELVSQNFQALLRLWPEAPAGIYSAGLNRRDANARICFASIQSVYRKAADLGPRHLVLIDEAHLVPNGGDGMYRKLLADLRETVPDLRVAGFSATPYRMDSGRLDEGDARLFDEVVYSYGVGAGIEDGWLSPLVSKRGAAEIDVSGVGSRGGEFIAGQLEAAADDDALTRAAVADMLDRAADRRSWLVFCAGVKHADHVTEALRAAGVTAACVTGDTAPGERDHLIREFRAGRIRALTSVGVLTTGFDAPNVDMIAFLRPTRSKGLFVQMCGRGTRLSEGKANCLVLDYAGNCRRMGPVDQIEIEAKRAGASMKVDADAVRAKECPQCGALVALNTRICRDCGHEWPASVDHDTRADDAPILSREIVTQAAEPLRVHNWTAKRHAKPGAPPSVRVEYMAGMQVYREWLLFEHGGYPARKAGQWWRLHGGDLPVPTTTEEAIVRWPSLNAPATITTRPSGKWFEIVGRTFESQQQEGEAA